MGELLLFLAAFGFIWGAWGFLASLAVFAIGFAISLALKPEHSYESNWGLVVSKLGTIILGIAAINAIWANIVVTAIAIAVVVIVLAVEAKH